ncbi:MAG TPA: M24 family metallopeptidase [Candidatus Obscuribacterales bacterium]
MSIETAQDHASKLNIEAIQDALVGEGIDGWLFYYFHENDPLALRILHLEGAHFFSRRWFYLIPAKGTPAKIVHRIESDALASLPGVDHVYLGWRQMESLLEKLIKPLKTVAMQYSPRNSVPYVSRIDAGIVELIRSLGADVVSSANLVQRFEAVWTPGQLDTHIHAADRLRTIIDEAFAEVRRCIDGGISLNEYELQQFILQAYERYGLVSSSPPIVAVNEHSGSPHYQPTAAKHWPIREGDFLLLDIWAKKRDPLDAVYADITWTGFVGRTVPDKYQEIFEIVRGARDAALAYVSMRIEESGIVHGWQVDDIARTYISERGYGDCFVHRTGHSIGVEVHANGANIDNLETRDERQIIDRTAFSIEPGIYLADFGVRSEIDAYVGDGKVHVYGQPIQTAVVPILTVK